MATPSISAITRFVFKTFIGNARVAFGFSWPWFVVLVPMQWLWLRVLSYIFEGDWIMFLLLSPLGMLPTLVAFSSFAVNLHRYMLLDELAVGWQRLRLDQFVVWYCMNLFLILVTITAVCAAIIASIWMLALASGFISDQNGTDDMGKALLLFAFSWALALLFASVLGLRLAIRLPAVAIGRTDFGYRQAWRCGAGKISLLLFLFVLSAAIAWVLPLPLLFWIAWKVVWMWLAAVLAVILLTVIYGVCAEGRSV
jgi:hypothetical protein